MVNKLRAVMDKKSGFTLMELLIVIAIIAILTVAFLPNALKAPAKARDAVRIKKVSEIQTAVEAYVAEKGSIPVNADAACMTEAFATTTLQLNAVPKDTSNLNSCGDGSKQLYFFRSNDTVDANNNKFYVVGAKVEVDGSKNTKHTLAELTAAAVKKLADAKALLTPSEDAAAEPYYIVVGPI